MSDPGAAFAWAFPPFFVGLWLGLFFVVSRWGGWRELAREYPSLGPASGTRLRMRSAQLRAGCNYNNCITFVSSPAGLDLSLPWVFRYQHPAIFLPWSELEVRREDTRFGAVVDLLPRRTPGIRIRLRKALAEQLLPESA
ncbi:MAG: hypothetical protein QNK05_04255 [Myxococcota bacterium]|nr:hypothetical protein [Myxococcota bacterium]